MDPYFINALLEHWYRALTRLEDPSSPPMFHPVRGTLAYSHGLILYAPLYACLRLAVAPFLAYNLTLVLVLGGGTACLFLLLRRSGASLVESLVLSGLFLSSPNVVNGETGVWSQRASVFLIPPILLLGAVSAALPGRRGLFASALAGGLAASMYTQDFYTAHFAALFAIVIAGTVIAVETDGRPGSRVRDLWTGAPRLARTALVIAILALAWTSFLWVSGGVEARVAGRRLSSHDVLRPLILSAVCAALYLYLRLRGRPLPPKVLGVRTGRLIGFAAGAAAGAAVFLAIYVDAYREHRAFPEEHLLNALVSPDPARWTTVSAVVDDLTAYRSPRSFAAALLLTAVLWAPWTMADARTRRYAAVFLVLSAMVFVAPLRFGELVVWSVAFEPLPGFEVIRDPKRIVFLYELVAVLAGAMLLRRLAGRPLLRRGVTVFLTVLLLVDWNRDHLETHRPMHLFDRIVTRPVAIDRSCTAFVIAAGGPEYTARSSDMITLYGIDAAFLALEHGIPTLNGYSAWSPRDWTLTNPHDDDYATRVRRWVARHALEGVCVFDPEARTMTPFQ
jgi:hypothetical protein